jgi:hypothetical protein
MNKKSNGMREEGAYVTAADEKAIEDARIATTKIDSVRGPPGAPIGWGVHGLANSVDPYAAK